MIGLPRAVAYIDLGALEDNYRAIRSVLPAHVKVLCVVKADAYGHGATEVAHRLETLDVDYLGVATLDEGRDLREQGITTPILVMSGILPWDGIGPFYRNSLTPAVGDIATLNRIEEELVSHESPLKIHVKVDTGMGRLGFTLDEVPYVIERIKARQDLDVEGLMTHFASSEVRDEYGLNQVRTFGKVATMFREGGVNPPILHMANSGALFKYDDAFFDMVRVGISLYGSYPAKELAGTIPVRPVMRFVTKIAYIKEYAEGTALSYGRTFVTNRRTRVAYVPVGYADGYPRALSNKGAVLIKGQRCSIVGRVCMDWFLVDITDFRDVGVEDEVTLIGQWENDAVTADEIAELAGTIPYEVLCKVSKRVLRVYV
jgi:alanine racemase